MNISLGENLKIDLDKLLTTRALVQANSGGGKSWFLRKLLEESHGKVQQIVLDIEGDFSSLREKFDFVLAGKDGDIPSQVRSAELLARKILELKSDLIVDLYELKQHERIQFVEKFLNSMVNAPKNLWHPVLIILDEAHIFAPEKGQSSAMGAVIDMATRGRKRGFCLVMATQRLSKLHKDAAAECNNKFIGRTGLDIDVKRAADELGLSLKEGPLLLRRLNPGDFYVYGPAISNEVKLSKVGEVQTKHPKAGKIEKRFAPAPSSRIKKVLGDLKDLPQEVEQDVQDKESMRRKIQELEKQIVFYKTQANSTYGSGIQSTRREEILRASLEKRLNEAVAKAKRDFKEQIMATLKALSTDVQESFKVKAVSEPSLEEKEKKFSVTTLISKIENGENIANLGACERKILGFLTAKPDNQFSKVQVGAMTGYAHGSGGFNNALSRLNQLGFIERSSGLIKVTHEGMAIGVQLGEVPHSLQDWVNKLGACERKIYSVCLENPSEKFDKLVLAEMTHYAAGSGGFNNALSRLNTLGLIRRESGKIMLNPEVNGI